MRHARLAGGVEPSNWRRRFTIAALTIAGFGVSAYLALFQLRIVGSVWDPIFGDGSRIVLRSSFSRSLPAPDALLGAISYLAETILGLSGPANRWRSKPRLVLMFGALVAAAAGVSLLLLGLQVFAYQRFCSLCLVSAALAWLIAALAVPEIAAAWSARLDTQRR